MTTTPVRAPEADPPPESAASDVPETDVIDAGAGERPVDLRMISLVALLATSAAGWLLTGLFDGAPARVAIMVLGAAGVVSAMLTARLSTPMRLLGPLLPLLVIVAASAGSASDGIVSAVRDALGSGQLAQPPVAFGPGWQLIVGGLLVSLGAASVHAAAAFASARLAVVLPTVAAAGLSLIQPPGRELIALIPAIVLLLSAFAVAQGETLSRTTVSGPRFDLPRLLRTAGLIALVVGVLSVLVQTTEVLPSNPEETTQPPRPPEPAVAVPDDASLFTVRAPQPVPLRLGVLDTYADGEWQTPTINPREATDLGEGELGPAPRADQVRAATITVSRPDTGRFLPLVPGAYSVTGLPADSRLTAGAGGVRLPIAAERGLTYTVRFHVPTGDELSSTTLTPATGELPPAPPAVQALLNRAPADLAARLRFMRGSFFDAAVEGEPGPPTPVSPARVDEILRGSAASPYELAAAEGLIVQWAGAQARIGYGYLQRTVSPGVGYDITADTGAQWVEVRSEDGEWIALTDRPHETDRVREQQRQEVILPNGQRIAQLAVPVQVTPPGFVYDVVRWWLARYLLGAAVLLALWLGLPGLLRGVRRIRRRRWAATHGPRAEIVVAYAGLRDKAIDVGIGTSTMTPLEFLDALTPDEDHVELGWLVDRAVYGDLRTTATERDAEAARLLSRAIGTRMVQGQTYLQRLAAFGSHESLREPWTRAVPNFYPTRGRRWSPRRATHRPPAPMWLLTRSRRLSRLWITHAARVRRLAIAALVLGALVGVPLLVGVQKLPIHTAAEAAPATALPQVPDGLLDYGFQPVPAAQQDFEARRDRALVGATELYVVTIKDRPQGTLQTGVLKAGLADRNLEIRGGLVRAYGLTDVQRVGSEVFYTRRLGDLDIALWFSPDGQAYQVLTTDRRVGSALRLFAQLVATQDGRDAHDVADITVLPPTDTRLWSHR